MTILLEKKISSSGDPAEVDLKTCYQVGTTSVDGKR